MTNILSYIKNIIKVLIWPIMFVIGQFLIILIFSFGFNATKYNEIKLANKNLDVEQLNIKFNDYIETESYQIELQNFINNNLIIITAITFIIFCFIFYKIYSKYKEDYSNRLNLKQIIILAVLGILLNLSYNLIIGGMNYAFHFTNNYDNFNINIITYIICTGMLGPILEEFLFRGIVFNKLKKFNKQMKSILLATIIFTIFHNNIIQMLYAFCLGFILIYVYEKYNTIKAPMIVHIFSNIMNIFTCMIIMKQNYLLNFILLMVSLGILFLINSKMIRKDLKTN